jgi:hypothetical protein
LILKNAPLVPRARPVPLPRIFREDIPAKIHQQKSRANLVALTRHFELDRFLRAFEIDRGKLYPGKEFRAAFSRRFLQLSGDRSHSAYRHFPFARLVSDQVIKKAAILQQ